MFEPKLELSWQEFVRQNLREEPPACNYLADGRMAPNCGPYYSQVWYLNSFEYHDGEMDRTDRKGAQDGASHLLSLWGKIRNQMSTGETDYLSIFTWRKSSGGF